MLFKRHATRHMNAHERRRFLKIMGLALASPLIPAAVQHAARELAFGEAHANERAEQGEPTYFIEINLRDQWDFGQVFVAPGLATHANLRRGESGRRCALYYEQNQLTRDSGVYLSPESLELRPHLDTIAMCELCELTDGRIHGHEAANAMRSPGRSKSGGPGRKAMYNAEPGYTEQGNEPHHSSTPTPATLHNYHQKQLDPQVRNGLAFKGISRFHTVYHFGGDLPGAELDRFQSTGALIDAFPSSVEDYNILPNENEARAITKLLRRADARFFERHAFDAAVRANHDQQLTDAQKIIYAGEPRIFDLNLTEAERAYWSRGVPAQRCNPTKVRANIWEQTAYAFKLVSNDVVRSVALEFDYVDVHDTRSQDQMEVMTLQAALPLARLIESLKMAGIYDRTLIAVYSTDGGRAPAANSAGNEGKNTVMLAGGMVQGGYYGDVRVAGDDGDGHRYSYHMPDLITGMPISNGTTGKDKRVSGAHIWRTVMKALQVPDALAGQFPDVQSAHALDFMLRT